MNKKIIKLTFFLIVISCSIAHAQDEVYLKIQSDGFKKINLAIAPIQSDIPTNMTLQIRDIMISDLTLSGFFKIYDESERSLSRDETDDLDAKLNGARVDGRLNFRGVELELNMILSELPMNRKIISKNFHAEPRSVRFLAHQVADEIVYYLIGERGIATSKIAYISERGGTKEVAVIDYDGINPVQLTFSNSLNLSPRWSPTGDRIAFTSYIMQNPDLLILPLKNRQAYRLSNRPGLNTAPSWAPDGKKIALTLTKDDNSELYAIEVKDGKLHRLTNHPAIDSSPSWSPDGREIVFTSDRSGAPQIYLMDSQGGNIRRLTFEGNYNDSPAWSPRGERIAFVARDERQFHICSINVTGEDFMKLTDGPGNNENPSWSPDGLRIAFASNRNGRWDIYIMNWDGSQLRKLTQNGGNISPSWSPRLKVE